MLLSNLWELIRASSTIIPFVQGGDRNLYCAASGIKNTSGTILPYIIGQSSSTSLGYSGLAQQNALGSTFRPFNGWSCSVGSGITPVSIDDYSLANDDTSSFSSTSTNVNISLDTDGKLLLTITWSGLNSSANDIIINEIGAKKTIYHSDSSPIWMATTTSFSTSDCLMMRHLLDSPVTVGPAKSVTITIQIKMA